MISREKIVRKALEVYCTAPGLGKYHSLSSNHGDRQRGDSLAEQVKVRRDVPPLQIVRIPLPWASLEPGAHMVGYYCNVD